MSSKYRRLRFHFGHSHFAGPLECQRFGLPLMSNSGYAHPRCAYSPSFSDGEVQEMFDLEVGWPATSHTVPTGKEF